MIIKNIHRAKEITFANQSILAIDFGTKRFGFAISDETQMIASPLENYERNFMNINKDIEHIKSLLTRYNSEIILFGLPKNLDNSLTITAEKVKSFANLLNQKFSINIFFWDERYSSKQANFITQNKEFRNQQNDKIAATIFLQSFLEFKKIL